MQAKATNPVDEYRKGLVLGTAQRLIAKNGKTTTLDIKNDLRKNHPNYYWPQNTDNNCLGVSEIMDGFFNQNLFAYSDNGTFRTYFNPVTAKKAVVKSATKNPSVKKAKPAKKAKSFTTTGTISRKKALDAMKNSGGRFFTVVFIKKDGTERTMNCQYLKDQTTSDLGYVKVRETGKMKTTPTDCVRQINLQTLKRFNTLKVK